MNKRMKIILALVLALGGTVRADGKHPNLHAKARLSYSTALGFKDETTVEVDGIAVRVDGVKLSADHAFASRPFMERALSVKKSGPAKTCASGQFLHEVTLEKKTRTEKGCLDDPRFAILQQSFKALQAWKGR